MHVVMQMHSLIVMQLLILMRLLISMQFTYQDALLKEKLLPFLAKVLTWSTQNQNHVLIVHPQDIYTKVGLQRQAEGPGRHRRPNQSSSFKILTNEKSEQD